MMETLWLHNAQKRYIVSIGNKILIVTHDYNYAKRLEKALAEGKYDESYSLVLRGRK